jgi:hypothetical protein
MKQVTMDDLNGIVNEINRIAEPLRRAGYGLNNNDEDEKELDAMIEREMEYWKLERVNGN